MQVLFREMQLGEKLDVERLYSRSLNLIDRIAFLLSFESAVKSADKQSGGTLVAEYDRRIVGSVSLRIQHISGKRAGFIDAFVTDKNLRGKSIGASLVDKAISWLEEWKCEVIYATVDRYNSPSWNTFIHRGFTVYEFPQQLRDHGLSFLRLWLGEFYFLGFGTFFLRRSIVEEPPSEEHEASHFMAAWLSMFLVFFIGVLRSGKPLALLPLLFATVGISLLAHELSQKLAAQRLGLKTTFKAWESGIFFSSLLALFGSFFPSYGSTYVKQLDYWYDPRKRETGAFFVVGPLVSLALAFTFWILTSLTVNDLLAAAWKAGYTMNMVMVVFNLIPIQAAGGFVWDGKKILTWNRTIWLLLVLGAAALIVNDAFL